MVFDQPIRLLILAFSTVPFVKVSSGRDAGAWYNAHFLRGLPGEVKRISRKKLKGDRRSNRCIGEPDFYSMPPLPNTSQPVTGATAGCPLPVGGGPITAGPRRAAIESLGPLKLFKYKPRDAAGIPGQSLMVPSEPSLYTKSGPRPGKTVIRRVSSLTMGDMNVPTPVTKSPMEGQQKITRVREAAMVTAAPGVPSPPSFAFDQTSSKRQILGAEHAKALIAAGLEPPPFAKAVCGDIFQTAPEVQVRGSATALGHDLREGLGVMVTGALAMRPPCSLASTSSSSPDLGTEDDKAALMVGLEPLPFAELERSDISLVEHEAKRTGMEPPLFDDEALIDEFTSYIDNVIQII